MKQIVKVGLLALLLGGAVALPVQEAGATVRCREVIRHGVVVKRMCTRGPDFYYQGHRDRGYRDRGYREWGYRNQGYRDWGYRTVCESYWRHGVKHRNCRRVHY